MLKSKELTALKRHADRLDRQAEQAKRHFDQMRAVFPHYVMGRDRGLIQTAAQHADEASRSARQFREGLDRILAGQEA